MTGRASARRVGVRQGWARSSQGVAGCDPHAGDPLRHRFVRHGRERFVGGENGGDNADSTANAFLSLVNVEEDRISKSNQNFIRRDNAITYQNRKGHLNLYLLFSVNLSTYSESLKRLSYIIRFFQFQNVFTPLTSPSLPAGVDELILDLHTLSFQDLNNLWGVMGSKYLPSVMYKMRMISISEELTRVQQRS